MNGKKIAETIKLRMALVSDDAFYNANTYKLCEAFRIMYVAGLIPEKTYQTYSREVNSIRINIFTRFSNSEEFIECCKTI